MGRIKRSVAGFLCVCMTASLLVACGKSETTTQNTEEATEVVTVEQDNAQDLENQIVQGEEETTELTAETLVTDSFTKEETIEYEDGYSLDVEYHVPEIQLDCVGAKEINKQIAEECKDIIEPENEYSYWWKVLYDVYLNGDVLSLVLQKVSEMNDYSECYTYNLNVATGETMSQKDLLAVVGTDEDTLLTGLRKEAAYTSDQMMASMFEPDYYNSEDLNEQFLQESYVQCLLMKNETISANNITMELSMYLDEDGELRVVTPVYVLAGVGVYEHLLKPRLVSRAKDFEITYQESVFVKNEKGKITIRFEEGAELPGEMVENGELAYGTEYNVEGVFKDYVDGRMISLDGGEYMVPIFLSDDGMVSYIDLPTCIKSGAFVMTEPAYRLSNVTEFKDKEEADILEALQKNIFERYDGFSQTVMGLYEGEGFDTATTYETEAGTEYTENYYIGFDMEDKEKFLYQSADYDAELYRCYEGSTTYLGMNENGMLFGYQVSEVESADELCGAFEVKRRGQWDEEVNDYLEWIDFRILGGQDLFGSGENTIELHVSVG